jgi:ribA/ribD-fused uncharacterized protein
MNSNGQQRTYIADECAVFRVTTEKYGGLSNMAGGFPLKVNDTTVWSSEALYQACRFPFEADIQRVVLAERSAMTAKMKSKKYRREYTRPDWDTIKVKLMKWCLRVKLAQNWQRFGEVLRSTGDKPIVEDSRKDDFWGAKQSEDGKLVGMNVLGRLLMELRQELASPNSEALRSVPVPDIPDFLLLGESIRPISSGSPSPEELKRGIINARPDLTKTSGATYSESLSEKSAAQSLWPKSTDADIAANAGVHLVGLKITNDLRYIFRPKPISDIGIDGEIEIRQQEKSHGRIIAVQIKAGPSYLRERTKVGFVYRGSMSHLRYWLNYSVPVIVILCDLTDSTCYWQLVDLEKVRFHERSWSMDVPYSQKLDSSAVESFRRISARFQKQDIVDVLFKNWFLESHYYELILADILEQPRDYHWLRFLGQDVNHRFTMADYVTADLRQFDQAQIDEMIRWGEHNHKQYTYDKLLLGLISETSQAFPINYKPKSIHGGLSVEMVPLILTLDDELKLCELGADGRLITAYFDHRAVDGCGAEVPQQRIKVLPSAFAEATPIQTD